MLKLKAVVLKTKKELLESGTKYATYSAFCYVPWLNRTLSGAALTAEEALHILRARIIKTMSNVEEVIEAEMYIASWPETEVPNELGTLMEAARERAQSITDPPLIGGDRPWSESASEEGTIQDRLIGTLLAIEPLAAIADAYDANGLDEARPEWVSNGREAYKPQKELYCGRGGKTLLTLQQAITAREVLRGTAPGRLIPRTFHRQKCALKQIRTWIHSQENANVIVSAIMNVLKELDT